MTSPGGAHRNRPPAKRQPRWAAWWAAWWPAQKAKPRGRVTVVGAAAFALLVGAVVITLTLRQQDNQTHAATQVAAQAADKAKEVAGPVVKQCASGGLGDVVTDDGKPVCQAAAEALAAPAVANPQGAIGVTAPTATVTVTPVPRPPVTLTEAAPPPATVTLPGVPSPYAAPPVTVTATATAPPAQTVTQTATAAPPPPDTVTQTVTATATPPPDTVTETTTPPPDTVTETPAPVTETTTAPAPVDDGSGDILPLPTMTDEPQPEPPAGPLTIPNPLGLLGGQQAPAQGDTTQRGHRHR